MVGLWEIDRAWYVQDVVYGGPVGNRQSLAVKDVVYGGPVGNRQSLAVKDVVYGGPVGNRQSLAVEDVVYGGPVGNRQSLAVEGVVYGGPVGSKREPGMFRIWRWIGHVLRKEQDAIPRVAVQWRPEGHRKRGRPKTTWRRTVEAEAAAMGQSWGTLRMLAQDRERWKEFVAALIANGKKGSNCVAVAAFVVGSAVVVAAAAVAVVAVVAFVVGSAVLVVAVYTCCVNVVVVGVVVAAAVM
ncbi:hypothetical protein EGW08_020929 [Elysia chlorotica]|uniref:Uncharacterized protein n=1 Tax=Elysia chlorotica TaxID=188477 RepID=A0A3S0Z5T6_ELYCH|nr:hypothetical protein EGW08_020929 [Elysia chlorotica]